MHGAGGGREHRTQHLPALLSALNSSEDLAKEHVCHAVSILALWFKPWFSKCGLWWSLDPLTGNSLEMQILKFYPILAISETLRLGPINSYFNKPSKRFWCKLIMRTTGLSAGLVRIWETGLNLKTEERSMERKRVLVLKMDDSLWPQGRWKGQGQRWYLRGEILMEFPLTFPSNPHTHF